jgi:hypothetical protein
MITSPQDLEPSKEKKLSEIQTQALGLDQVGIDDQFLKSGGDWLRAKQLAADEE